MSLYSVITYLSAITKILIHSIIHWLNSVQISHCLIAVSHINVFMYHLYQDPKGVNMLSLFVMYIKSILILNFTYVIFLLIVYWLKNWGFGFIEFATILPIMSIRYSYDYRGKSELFFSWLEYYRVMQYSSIRFPCSSFLWCFEKKKKNCMRLRSWMKSIHKEAEGTALW